MVWVVSLLTTKLSPRRLTHRLAVVAFAVWLGLVTSTWPRTHPALYLHHRCDCGCTSIHFGENQLSPCSISISPLPTSHPLVLQHKWVRASTNCHIRFTLLMGSSHGFGSHPRHAMRRFSTRLPSGCAPLAGLNLRRRCTRRIILQKARH